MNHGTREDKEEDRYWVEEEDRYRVETVENLAIACCHMTENKMTLIHCNIQL